MAPATSLTDYEERYRRVFAAGATHWNDPEPNRHLAEMLEGLPAGMNCIEFGCGEGYQARYLASRGHRVTGIDLSPTAIAKAKREAPTELGIHFLVADVTARKIPELPTGAFQLALNIDCLHMMAEDSDRNAHLNLAFHLLAPRGTFFLCNGLSLDDVVAESEEETQQLERLRRALLPQADGERETTIDTAGGPKQLKLPHCPCRMLTLDGYTRELEARGFRIRSARRCRGGNFPYSAVMIAEKP